MPIMRESEETGDKTSSILEEIIASNKQASLWFSEQTSEKQQEILAILKNNGDIGAAIDQIDGHYRAKDIAETIGANEELDKFLPKKNGEIKELTLTTLDEDYNQSSKNFTIKKQDEKYYSIDGDTETPVFTEGITVNIQVSFADEIDKLLEKYQKENNIEQAIKDKNFGLINRIIKNGTNIADDKIKQVMRLSTLEKQGEKEYYPTFLHKLLDPKQGIADSKHAVEFIEKARKLLRIFEYDSLLNLSDGVKPAYELFSSKELRKLRTDNIRPRGSNITSEIDTHQESVHASVDISAAKLYQRFQARHSDVAPMSTATEKGRVVIEKSAAFNNLIDSRVKALQGQIESWLAKPDMELKEMLAQAKITSDVDELKFNLSAAKRLVDDCINHGVMHQGDYRTEFNVPFTNGLSLKEALALTYDALSDDENLIFTNSSTKESDRISHFNKLVTYLKETRREYSESKEDEDRNKCSGGSMNHVVYSLQGSYNPSIVDIAYVTEENIREAANEVANQYLLDKISKVPALEQERLKIALIKSQYGVSLRESLDERLLAELKKQVRSGIKAGYDQYYRNESYLTEAQNSINSFEINSQLKEVIKEIDYEKLFTPQELADKMQSKHLPLYTRTDTGYHRTISVIKDKNSDYYKQVIGHIIDHSKSDDLLENYHLIPDILSRFEESEDIKLSHTLLFIAALEDHKDVALKLIEKVKPEDLTIKNSDGDIALHWAANKGHLDIVLKLIEKMKPEDLAIKNSYDQTALHWAANKGHLDIVLKLIEKMKPEDLAIQNNYDQTVLHWAANEGHLDIVLKLIEKMKPEDLTIKNSYGDTALHLAANEGHLDIALKLIEEMKSEDLAIKNSDDQTALHLAAYGGHLDIVLKLIGKMTPEQLAIKDRNGHNVLHWAVNKGHLDIVLKLIGKMTPEQLAIKNNDDKTALHLAANEGHLDIALQLIEEMKSEDLAIKNSYDQTALHLAAYGGHLDIVLKLIRKMKPEDLIIKNRYDRTALHSALFEDYSDIALQLIEKMTPEQLAIQNRDGYNALHLAANGGQLDIVLKLIEKMKPEDLTIKNNYNQTALHVAANGGHLDIVLKLIEKMKPEDLAIQNNYNQTALHVAANGGHLDIVLKLIEKMKPEDLAIQNNYDQTALHVAANGGHLDIVLKLIEKMKPEDLAIQNNYNQTALHLAVFEDHSDIALQLIEKMTPEQLAIQNREGNNALHVAAQGGHLDIALQLIKTMKPEQLAIKNNDGQTALHVAANRERHDIVLQLIEKMTPEQLAIKNNDGQTALHWALFEDHSDIVLALIKKMKPADLAIQNIDGYNALYGAVRKGHLDIVLELIDKMKPEDLAIQDRHGHNALHFAAQYRPDIALKLIEKMNPEDLAIQNRFGYTVLHISANKGRYDISPKLIEKMTPEQLAIMDSEGQTALDIAIKYGKSELSLYLIAATNSFNEGYRKIFEKCKEFQKAAADRDIAKSSALLENNPYLAYAKSDEAKAMLKLLNESRALGDHSAALFANAQGRSSSPTNRDSSRGR